MARIKASEKMNRIIRMLQHIKDTYYDSDEIDVLIYKAITLKNEILIDEEMKKGKRHEGTRTERERTADQN